jgi:hypothetical protein
MPPDLDELMSRSECAAWLRVSERGLADKSSGLRPTIPAVRLGFRSIRYHPRTILAVLAARAGVAPEIIAAGYSIEARRAR